MRNRKYLAVIAVLLLAIGFATVSTVLYINGTINVAPDEAGFKEGITFKDVSITNGTVASGEGLDTITFTTEDFSNIGDEAVLTYKINNASSYDAKVTGITCRFYNSETAEYDIKTNDYVSIMPASGFYPVTVNKSTTSEATTLTVKQIKSYAGTSESNEFTLKYQCKLDVTTDTDAASTGDTKEGSGKYTIITDDNSNGTADVGDEIQVNGENFYVISNDGTIISALAKYNLNVGTYKVEGTEGVQNELAKGYDTTVVAYNNRSAFDGGVHFSSVNGWTAGSNIDIQNYDGDVKTAINNYKAVVTDASNIRLITRDELISLGCDNITGYCTNRVYTCTETDVDGGEELFYDNSGNSFKCTSVGQQIGEPGFAPSWVYSSSYWTETSHVLDASYVWTVQIEGDSSYTTAIEEDNSYLNWDHYSDGDLFYGVRPVIEIEA